MQINSIGLITHFPLFTTMFTSQLTKEAEFKNAQPCKVFSSNITHFDLSSPFPFLALLAAKKDETWATFSCWFFRKQTMH